MVQRHGRVIVAIVKWGHARSCQSVVTPHPHWRYEAPNPQWTLNGEAIICNTDVLTGGRVEAEVRNLMAIRVSSFMQAQAMVRSGGCHFISSHRRRDAPTQASNCLYCF